MNITEYKEYLQSLNMMSLQDIYNSISKEQQPERYEAVCHEIDIRLSPKAINPINVNYYDFFDALTVIGISISKVLKNYQFLSKALALPMLILVLNAYYNTPVSFKSLPNVSSIALFIVATFAHTLVAITIHNTILRGNKSISAWGINKIGKRELIFTGYGLLIGIFSVIPTIAILFLKKYLNSGIAIFAIFASFLFILFFIARLSIIFPSIAIDKKIGFHEAWKATQSYKMLLIICLFAIPFFIGFSKYVFTQYSSMPIVVEIAQVLAIVFTVASLSSAYKIITGNINPKDFTKLDSFDTERKYQFQESE